MPRTARIIVPGYFYHLTQRGNNRQQVFLDDTDRRQYVSWIEKYRKEYGVKIFVYCLMDNHVHFIAIPEKENSFARLFNTVHMRYAQHFNQRYDQCGHVWQGRYYSCLLEGNHFLCAARYVERNPVRAGISRNPWDWPWSSASQHIGKSKGQIQLADINQYTDTMTWRDYIKEEDNETDLKIIRQKTKSGRIFGK